MTDQVDRILSQWHAEKPDLDVLPMAIIGRLSRTTEAIHTRLDATFALHDLDASSFDVLATLLRSGSPYRITPAELAREAMISSSAVAQRLNKLEARGLVRREAHPTDGRGTFVALTEAGKNAIERALPDHLDTEHAIVATLSLEEQIVLAGLLTRLLNSATSEQLEPNQIAQ